MENLPGLVVSFAGKTALKTLKIPQQKSITSENLVENVKTLKLSRCVHTIIDLEIPQFTCLDVKDFCDIGRYPSTIYLKRFKNF